MKATYTGERIHMDVSGPFPPTLGGHRHWVMFKDQYSAMAWNVFTPNKDKVYEITKEKFYYFAGLKKKIRFFRCDNAGQYGKILTFMSQAWCYYGIYSTLHTSTKWSR
jgi:hypothetical protein